MKTESFNKADRIEKERTGQGRETAVSKCRRRREK